MMLYRLKIKEWEQHLKDEKVTRLEAMKGKMGKVVSKQTNESTDENEKEGEKEGENGDDDEDEIPENDDDVDDDDDDGTDSDEEDDCEEDDVEEGESGIGSDEKEQSSTGIEKQSSGRKTTSKVNSDGHRLAEVKSREKSGNGFKSAKSTKLQPTAEKSQHRKESKSAGNSIGGSSKVSSVEAKTSKKRKLNSDSQESTSIHNSTQKKPRINSGLNGEKKNSIGNKKSSDRKKSLRGSSPASGSSKNSGSSGMFAGLHAASGSGKLVSISEADQKMKPKRK
jgi:hypothetical protein